MLYWHHMEPILPSPHGNPEVGPVAPRGPESLPNPQQGPERQRSIEQPAPEEKKTGAGAGDFPVAPAPVIPPPPQAAPTTTTSYDPDDDNPAVAGDEDLIEKEWVDRAKKVISETKHDPYAQEQAFSRLQADYIRKRYGKEIKLPEDV